MTKKTTKVPAVKAKPAKAAAVKKPAVKTAPTVKAVPVKKVAAAKSSASPAVEKIVKAAKSAAKPAESRTPAVKKAAKPEAPVTVVIRHDAGWGNHLHLRGEGPGLSWDRGAPLCCVHGDEWVWVAPASGAVTFKILHNDSTWATGENITVKAGETVTLRPAF